MTPCIHCHTTMVRIPSESYRGLQRLRGMGGAARERRALEKRYLDSLGPGNRHAAMLPPITLEQRQDGRWEHEMRACPTPDEVIDRAENEESVDLARRQLRNRTPRRLRDIAG